MNKPYSDRKEYAVWLERGYAIGRCLNRLSKSRILNGIFEAPSTGLTRLRHLFELVTRHRPPMN